MREITDIKEVHSILLDIAKEFHNICVKHNIPYYMLGGTMLGAVRHKGFIPWDDDMDFGIPRKYYEKFREISRIELPQQYKFVDYDNSKYAILGIGKITDTRTELKEQFSVQTSEKLGVYVDIFPLEITDEKVGILSFNKRMRYLFKLQKLVCVNPNDRTLFTKTLSKIIQFIIPINKDAIPRYIEKSCMNRKNVTSHNYVFNIYGAWGLKELIPKQFFGTPTLYQFEETEFFGVEVPDLYLKSLYGNYMQLPSEDKRHTHISNVLYKE